MNNTTAEYLLDVRNLTVSFSGEVAYTALDHVSFGIARGKSLALLGASGSGKSVTSLAIMGLLANNATVNGEIYWNGKVLGKDTNWENIRGKEIAMIFQEPMSSLNPLMSCGKQLLESIQTHQPNLSTLAAKEEALYWLQQVKLPQADQLFHKYPHELSGGQKQRVMIAMALCNRLQLIIADEPTTALDVLVQKDILDLLKTLQIQHQCALLFITHDMGVAKYIADEVVILDKGRVVSTDLASYAQSVQLTHSDLETVSSTNLVEVEDLSVTFTTKKNIWGKPLIQFDAVKQVSFQIAKGKTLGLVGGSGCGKSTVSKCIMGIVPLAGGSITFDGQTYEHLRKKDWINLRKEMQMIFQDPHASLSPKMNVKDMLKEVIEVHGIVTGKQAVDEFIHNLLDKVGLPLTALEKYPHEFSGGQKQRLCIARALAVKPKFIICDESIAALDTKMQTQILELLQTIQATDGITYLFITHDLRIAEMFCDEIAVMQDGKIIEYGPAHQVLGAPQQAYTKLLKSAML